MSAYRRLPVGDRYLAACLRGAAKVHRRLGNERREFELLKEYNDLTPDVFLADVRPLMALSRLVDLLGRRDPDGGRPNPGRPGDECFAACRRALEGERRFLKKLLPDQSREWQALAEKVDSCTTLPELAAQLETVLARARYATPGLRSGLVVRTAPMVRILRDVGQSDRATSLLEVMVATQELDTPPAAMNDGVGVCMVKARDALDHVVLRNFLIAKKGPGGGGAQSVLALEHLIDLYQSLPADHELGVCLAQHLDLSTIPG